jgi:co-chaperonin GroES (HSP10)
MSTVRIRYKTDEIRFLIPENMQAMKCMPNRAVVIMCQKSETLSGIIVPDKTQRRKRVYAGLVWSAGENPQGIEAGSVVLIRPFHGKRVLFRCGTDTVEVRFIGTSWIVQGFIEEVPLHKSILAEAAKDGSFKPYGSNVLVRLSEEVRKKGMIHLPDSASFREETVEVLAAGPDANPDIVIGGEYWFDSGSVCILDQGDGAGTLAIIDGRGLLAQKI